ncbi:UDP-3-O-(3-hydroxymyristoyl)glucosamine N-acyltransferase [Gammaproteobacteria bacterium AB-CW1]|uniref:UDP-3-O-acylglucosamine N-acyltransferase n=1 Tax=Natronospira elongata TaxID=3110268 RepID=A0AAP6JDG6_9GAMM|nr:UDP-3-O-(3-hydroxymyristoyl)glucosamine N-acyltransferase [Gammaproteobacteria bacterium AB-CW1]
MTLGELAEALGLQLEGDPARRIESVATIQSAGPGELCFLANDRYRQHLRSTRAGAVILHARDAADCPVAALLSDNPYADYARAAALLHPAGKAEAGISSSASVDPGATLGEGVHVGAGAVVGAGVELADGVEIGPGCVVAGPSRIGAGSRLRPRVVIEPGVTIGRDCLIHAGVVIGADGFGFAPDGDDWVKVPQLGGVRIGDRVELGAATTVDRGAIEDTVIGDGVKLDNQVQVAHNVQIGANTVIAGCTAIAGSSKIGRSCMIAGGVGIAGHLTITDGAVVTAMTLVSRDIREPGIYSGSLPMDDGASWRKNSARFRKLDDLARRVARLERELKDKGEKS